MSSTTHVSLVSGVSVQLSYQDTGPTVVFSMPVCHSLSRRVSLADPLARTLCVVGARFNRAMQLMRRHDPEVQEKGFAMLRPHAREYLEELIAEFRREPGRMLLPHLQAGVQFRAVSYPLSGLLRGLLVPA